MLKSGWILPDFYEVKCKSCSTVNGHIDIVKRYLASLNEKDVALYEKIMYEFYKLKKSQDVLALDDFAVIKLGWIKVNDYPVNILFYARDEDTELMLKRHLDFGYEPVVLEKSLPIVSVYIPSKELI